MNLRPGQQTNDDQIQLSTRVTAALLIPALVTAFVILYLFPNDSGRYFAWPIRPPMSAMMLGATYLGGAYFFARVLTQKWQEMELGFWPVTAFATIMGINTILHWDLFTQGHFAFYMWVFLYFTVPFLLPILWYRNKLANAGSPAIGLQLSRPARLVFAALGALLTVVSLLLLVVPTLLIPTWPWTLSPLTARVMSAMFILPGLTSLGIARNGRWNASRYLLHAEAISIVLILLAIFLRSGEIDWSRASAWLFVTGMSLVLALVVAALTLFAHTDERARQNTRRLRNVAEVKDVSG